MSEILNQMKTKFSNKNKLTKPQTSKYIRGPTDRTRRRIGHRIHSRKRREFNNNGNSKIKISKNTRKPKHDNNENSPKQKLDKELVIVMDQMKKSEFEKPAVPQPHEQIKFRTSASSSSDTSGSTNFLAESEPGSQTKRGNA
ncbi:hypothetical protein JTB14_000240 [Gonioctena quinquepunctata]|nr:hypothetical protein JTB14_000240 [Gonioctena quinquepunctata]